MANGFDRRGAVVGAILLLIILVVGAVVLFPPTISIKVNLPPVQAAHQ